MYIPPKIIELDDLSPQGEPSIQIVTPYEYNRFGHVKVASEALDYIKTVKPIPGKTIILVLAMTAGEYYGPNRNGDAWPEKPLVVAGKVPIGPEAVLPKHYRTFETNANVFRHHVNKDPAKSIGKVLRAFYNWKMHRVELLLALANELAEDIIARIEKGEFPAVSMGCKVKHDVCDICGNIAPTRLQYCSHARNHLGDILSNGRRVFVWNPSPKFFDISMVRKPADEVGYMMKKVADRIPEVWSSAARGEYYDTLSQKAANLRKLSLIDKIIDGGAAATKEENGTITLSQLSDEIAKPAALDMPPLDDSSIQHLARYNPAEVLSTLSSMGIILTTPEFIKFFVAKIAPGVTVPEEILDRAVAIQGEIYDTLADHPEVVEEMEDTGFVDVNPERVNPKLARELRPLLEKRSQIGSYLYRHYVPEIFKEYPTRGKWDIVTTTDPRTGKAYQTTYGAATKAQDVAAKRRLGNVFGGGALLAGGALLGAVPGLRALAPFVAIPGALKTMKGVSGYPSVRSNRGDEIPVRYSSTSHTMAPFRDLGFRGTELIEKRSALVGPAEIHLAIKTAMDHAHRPNARRIPRTKIAAPEYETTFDTLAAIVGHAILP